MTGTLSGLRIVEMAGIGPAPFCGMMLADHGAEVIRVLRPGMVTSLGDPAKDILNRNRLTLTIDLKQAAGVALVRELCDGAAGLIEGFRPGVMERMGLGPDELLGRNPRLVYGRMTGWGQEGPLSDAPGHDINYIALSGNLHGYGRAGEKPTPPINAVGDFGGGGMLLAFGMLAGILHAERTGVGQVVDCAMTDGAALLAAMTWTFRAQGAWRHERGTNLLDTGAHFYDSYECADGKYVAVGAIEPQFYAALRERLGLGDDPQVARQLDAGAWPELKARFSTLFLERTRDDWCALLEGSDACVSPVLSMAEAPEHPHHRARGAFVQAGGVVQPAPGPRFASAPAAPVRMPQAADKTVTILGELGFPADRIRALVEAGAIAGASGWA